MKESSQGIDVQQYLLVYHSIQLIGSPV